jgi:hypothetical protein
MHKLVYTDEQDLRIYESLPSTDFKEFFMAYFKYKKGDKVEPTDFTNPVTFALFNSYIPKLDKNEDTYNKKVQANKENGKKGGRPKKSVITEVENNEFQVEQNTADLSPSNDEEVEQSQPTRDNTAESLKIGNNEITEDNTCMERKPLIKIAASKHNSDVERLQDIINTDNDFYSIYGKCVKAVADYKINSDDIIKANTKEMAMDDLKKLLHSYQIPYNKETHNFFLDDVNYSISNMGSYSVA